VPFIIGGPCAPLNAAFGGILNLNDMEIWEHQYNSSSIVQPKFIQRRWESLRHCRYCDAELKNYPVDYEHVDKNITLFIHAWVCNDCGWWFFERYEEGEIIHGMFGGKSYNHDYGSRRYSRCGSLKELDLSDINLPLEEIRSYLVARYSERHAVHPKRFEDVVASVMRDFGYSAVVTSYHADDGIDVILNSGGDLVGVQVKRYRNSISVEQIRSFAGALLIGGYTRGIFVTTSEYQKGCKRTAELSADAGKAIELWDACRFLDALRIAQRHHSYESAEIQGMVQNIDLVLTSQSIGSCSRSKSIPIL
jgi:restriction system protein